MKKPSKDRLVKVYIAGKLNDTAVDYIKNLHTMIATAVEIRKAGYSVLVPCLDILCGLLAGNWEYDDYFGNNQPWLECADAIFLCPNWQNSKGATKEFELANEKKIPAFTNLYNMNDYFGTDRKYGR